MRRSSATSSSRSPSATSERDAAFRQLRRALDRAEQHMEAVQSELASVREAMEGAQAASLSDLALSVPRAAQLLDVSKSTLYRLIEQRKVAAIHIERTTRIPLRELEAYMAAKVAEQEG